MPKPARVPLLDPAAGRSGWCSGTALCEVGGGRWGEGGHSVSLCLLCPGQLSSPARHYRRAFSFPADQTQSYLLKAKKKKRYFDLEILGLDVRFLLKVTKCCSNDVSHWVLIS